MSMNGYVINIQAIQKKTQYANHLSLLDGDDDLLHLALVQYVFKEVEHEVIAAPHGSSKHDDKYMRTMPSVMAKLKKVAGKSTPKNAVEIVSKKAGGVLSAPSAGARPRGRQQVKDIRRASSSDVDPLYSVMMMCKESEGRKNKDAFVHQVNAAPYPMMCLTFDWTLHDLAQFCTNPKNFSILGVDPTFDLGDFDVTVTTYRHLMLELKGSSHPKHPVFLGPLFVHVRKNFEAYHFFASTLVSKCPELRCIQCFGTDGEEVLSKALSTVFRSAEHIHCFLHFRGIGLVDAESIDELDVMIDSLESIIMESTQKAIQ